MENILKVYPVMLPQVGEPIFPCICMGTPELGLRYTESKFGLESTQYFSLYLVSDREIKEGDWFTNGVKAYPFFPMDKNLKTIRKIEATTDKSLGLPLIPESFIKEWVEKQGKIEYVYIQMHTTDLRENSNDVPELIIQPFIRNGEVIILPTKDVFTKEDMLSAWFHGYDRHRSEEGIARFNEWFDKNY